MRYANGETFHPSDVLSSFERLWKSGSPDIFFRGNGLLVGAAR